MVESVVGTCSQANRLSVVEGGEDEQEKDFQRLLAEPHTFGQAEFEHLMDNTFKTRLDFAGRMAIIEKRIRLRDYGDALEQRALLAIIEEDHEDVTHLFDVIDRRNSLGLKVISSS